MIIRSADLEIVCGITSEIPDTDYPEIAFAGKSNVGKSSLINTLLNRKGLARTSSQPGKTQTINFYNINQTMYLVDLPGYGYATASVEIKAQWGKMIERYLHTSKQLLAVFLLIDVRHEPSDNDCLMYQWMLEQGYSPVIIATKMDKISRGELDRNIARMRKVLGTKEDTVILPFSAQTKQGTEEIWRLIETLAFSAPLEEETRAQQQARIAHEKQVAEQKAIADAQARGEEYAPKKERWKKTGHPVAKKTAQKHQAKKAAKHKALGKNPNKRK